MKQRLFMLLPLVVLDGISVSVDACRPEGRGKRCSARDAFWESRASPQRLRKQTLECSSPEECRTTEAEWW